MHVRCPHCHNPIELADDSSMSDIPCPTCGSSFSLVADLETTEDYAGGYKTIGHFQLVRKIGVGAFGSVWKANDTELDRTVAVKIPRKGQLDGEEAEKFLREARAAAQLKHPNIVSVHEVGRDDGRIYIVSDFVQGPTLADRLTAGPMSIREAAQLTSQVAEALDHAHEQGVVHRDLKPSNIMLDENAVPHVMDFGLAKRETGEITMTVEGQLLGTPAYMPPEQAQGEGHHADRRSDVYSLGVILFELLTGERPFRGNKRMLLHQVVHEDAPSPRTLNSSIPRDLETICLKCLEKDAQRRYPTAQHLADELQRFLSNQPIHARPISSLARAWRWCERNTVVASLAALIALSLLSGMGVSAFLANQWSDEAAFAKSETKRANAKAGEASKNAEDAERRRNEADLARGEEAAARRLAESRLARNYLQRGQSSCEAGNFGRGLLWMAKALETAPPDASGLVRAIRKNITNYRASLHSLRASVHVGREYTIAFSPDGQTLLTKDEGPQRTAKLRNATTGDVIGQAIQHDDEIVAADFSPDSKMVATASLDKTVKLWDAATGQPVGMPLTHEHGVVAVAFHPDGKSVLTGGLGKTGQLWSVESREAVGAPISHKGTVLAVAFSRDGKVLLTGSDDKTAQVWNSETMQPIGSALRHPSGVQAVALSPDKQLVLTGSSNTVQLWRAETGESVGDPIETNGPVSCVAFSPSGESFLTATRSRTAKLWATSTQRPIGQPLPFQFPVDVAEFSADGALIRAGGFWSARVFNVAAGGAARAIVQGMETPIFGVDLSPDGARLAVGEGKMAQLLDAATGDRVGASLEHAANVLTVTFSPDGKTLLTTCSDNSARIWDIAKGELIGPVLPAQHTGALKPAIFSPDGRAVLTISSEDAVQILDATTGKLIGEEWSCQAEVNVIGFSRDSQTAYVGCADRRSWFWEVGTNRRKSLQHPEPPYSVAFSPDGKTALVGTHHRIDFVEIRTGQYRGGVSHQGGAIRAVDFTQDGKRALTASSDGTVRVWDVNEQQIVERPMVHPAGVYFASFTADGETIVSLSADRTLRIWDAASGEMLGRSPERAANAYVLDADGTTVFMGGTKGFVRRWLIPEEFRGEPDEVTTILELDTGMTVNEHGSIDVIMGMDWREKQKRRP